MKFLATILTSIYNTTVNTNRWVKFIATVVLLVGSFVIGANYYTKAKVKPCEDCGFFKAQNAELLEALIGIKKDLKEVAQSTRYIMDEMPITAMYASYDSVPKKKQTQQQIKLGAIANRIDSILRVQQQRQAKQ